MIVLVGASASGKTELAKLLYQTYGYHKCVTTTTRSPRHNEKNGIDYHFLSHEAFDALIEKDGFLEVTRYQNEKYGIQKKDVDVHGVVIVDPDGANTLAYKLKEDAYIIYVETSESLRSYRMHLRKDQPDMIEKRLEFDRRVFHKEHFVKIDLIVNNEDRPLEDLAFYVHQAYQLYLKAVVKKV
jgi:guanylate kinase